MSTQKNTKPLLEILLGTLSLFIALTPFSVQAQNEELQDYFGLEIPYTFVNYSQVTLVSDPAGNFPFDFEKIFEGNLPGIGVYYGSRTENYGFESAVSTTFSPKKDSVVTYPNGDTLNFTSDSSISTLSFDVLAFLPLNESKTFELMGSLGIVLSSLRGTFKPSTTSRSGSDIKVRQEEFKPRVGVGFQYKIADKWKIRTVARWQDSSFVDPDYNPSLTKGLYNISVSVNYDL